MPVLFADSLDGESTAGLSCAPVFDQFVDQRLERFERQRRGAAGPWSPWPGIQNPAMPQVVLAPEIS
ncbi:hypothetical protein CQ019_06135 [Arthrobacter sp. MYb229]|uniref:hypothetical protein n=1 Tax=unclassified Arthrobacter TaxID=235627 RepID=UPI000CFB57D6|nr:MULTISPECIES: hypothetical protein [unclassified Arthrobacter]PRA06925.1 hypothetical protein CQ019_06135 [Arthrobacter sp. MYb229]PRB47873.1 hypothetical protein CQ013_15930 [Arthrobacter sp. MYb216]